MPINAKSFTSEQEAKVRERVRYMIESCEGNREHWIDADVWSQAFATIDGLRATIHEHDAMELPVRMIIHCPLCHGKHVDRDEWATPAKAHRTHLCEYCGALFRLSDTPTVGVEKLGSQL